MFPSSAHLTMLSMHCSDTLSPSVKSVPEGAFETFVHWRRSTSAVLHSAARIAVAPWQIREKQDAGGPEGELQAQAARKLPFVRLRTTPLTKFRQQSRLEGHLKSA
eukprot:1156785-Pelagomonas_calceolata.AAC.5